MRRWWQQQRGEGGSLLLLLLLLRPPCVAALYGLPGSGCAGVGLAGACLSTLGEGPWLCWKDILTCIQDPGRVQDPGL